MTQQEFNALTGDQLTDEVNSLYQALPEMNKADFCALYRLNKALMTHAASDIFENLRRTVEDYAELAAKAAELGMPDALQPIERTREARKEEEHLMAILVAMQPRKEVAA